MITITLADLESRLERSAPTTYVKWLSSHSPEDAAKRRFDPKAVCVLNLWLRETFVESSWEVHSDKFFISGDGCGNYYFIPDDADRVLLLAHDSDGIEDSEQSVSEFFDTEQGSDLLEENVHDNLPAVVTRTAIIGESVLEPISLVEYQAAMEKTLRFCYIEEYSGAPLYFGNVDGVEIEAELIFGRIEIWTRTLDKGALETALAVANRLARHLAAHVLRGSDSPSPHGWFDVTRVRGVTGA